jgi:hypothetical protein
MPFTKTAPNSYKSPSGKTFSKKQVIAYYATEGFKLKPKVTTNGFKKQVQKGARKRG